MATDLHDITTTELPTPGAGPQMRMVEVALIEESTTNPRKHFDQAKLQELADSIAATGVHQPILLRPLPGHRVPDTWGFRRKGAPLPEYELVAGARRLRACRLAQVAEVPAMIRELTDEQALEIQVIENLQREDVTELEEAEGYEVLMRTGNLNADQVAAKIGKSRSYVYARLKLLDLSQKGREALRKGEIDFSRALLLARIANEGLQLKALKFCVRAGWDGERPSYRECARHVQDEYMLKLDTARFKIADASLVPAAGSCKECTKRTGANPDLFSDVKSADVCTDPACFRQKEEAHTAALARQAKEKGQNVILGKEAEELATSGWNMKLKGYRRLDHVDDSPSDQPLRKIIGAQMKAEGIEPTMIENPRKKGELLATLPNEVALRLLKAVEAKAQAAEAVSKEAQEFLEEKNAKAEAKAKAQYEQAWRDQLLARAWQRMNEAQFARPIFTLDVHRYLALRTVNRLSTEAAQAIACTLGLDKVGAHSALCEFAKTTVSPDFLQLLCIMQQDSSASDYAYGNHVANEGLHLVAGNVFGDATKEVIAEVKAEARKRYLTPAKPAKAAAPKPAPPNGPAAPAPAVRGGGKAKKASAARAGAETPKTSAAHASAQIAEALARSGRAHV